MKIAIIGAYTVSADLLRTALERAKAKWPDASIVCDTRDHPRVVGAGVWTEVESYNFTQRFDVVATAMPWHKSYGLKQEWPKPDLAIALWNTNDHEFAYAVSCFTANRVEVYAYLGKTGKWSTNQKMIQELAIQKYTGAPI